MSRNISRFATILLCFAVAMTPVAADDGGLEVGTLLYRVALARNLPATDGSDAAELLRASGVALPALSLDQQATEGTVVAVSRALGIQVTTTRPDSPFQGGLLDAYLDLVAAVPALPERSASTGEPGPYPRPNDNAADPRTKGRGKKKGLPPVSPSSPI